jgi:molecular chaperone GrpE
MARKTDKKKNKRKDQVENRNTNPANEATTGSFGFETDVSENESNHDKATGNDTGAAGTTEENGNRSDNLQESAGMDTDSYDEVIRKLMDQLEQKNDQLLRKAAEFENMRKRVQNERIRLYEDARIEALQYFLPVNDDLQRTVQVLKESGLDETYLRGIELVAGKMNSILNHYGVEKIDETGVPFNVELHDALMRQKAADDKTPADTVLQILEPGYRIGDRVIRHAKVIVSE